MSAKKGRALGDVLSREQLRSFKRAFDHCDKNNDGQLTHEEFISALRMVGIVPTQEELRAMLTEINNDDVSISDFILVSYYFLRGADTRDELIRAFAVFDEDNDGKIDVETIRNILANLRHPVPKEQIDEIVAKLEKDGAIDYAEMIRELRPQ